MRQKTIFDKLENATSSPEVVKEADEFLSQVDQASVRYERWTSSDSGAVPSEILLKKGQLMTAEQTLDQLENEKQTRRGDFYPAQTNVAQSSQAQAT